MQKYKKTKPQASFVGEVFNFRDRSEWRQWLEKNSSVEKECHVVVSRSRTPQSGVLSYLDAVEEALCFGWIDSVVHKGDTIGCCIQRFSPRRNCGQWTELNRARCRRLIDLGLMTDAGMKVLPENFGEAFVIDDFVVKALQGDEALWRAVQAQPELYRRVRIDGIQSEARRGRMESALRRLARYVECSRAGILYGEWNDYGRLLK